MSTTSWALFLFFWKTTQRIHLHSNCSFAIPNIPHIPGHGGQEFTWQAPGSPSPPGPGGPDDGPEPGTQAGAAGGPGGSQQCAESARYGTSQGIAVNRVWRRQDKQQHPPLADNGLSVSLKVDVLLRCHPSPTSPSPEFITFTSHGNAMIDSRWFPKG